MPTRRSRLQYERKRRTKHTFAISVVLLLVFVVSIFTFGIPLIINLSLFFEKKIDASSDGKSESVFIPRPQLDFAPLATNSAYMDFSGTALEADEVLLYVNDKKVADESLSDDGDFTIESVQLREGKNEVFARSSVGDETSSKSNVIVVNYLNEPPSLSVNNPSNGQTIKGSNMLTVEGKTDPGVRVTVNGFWAVMKSDGSFSYRLRLNDGNNAITVEAKDEAGNTEKQDLAVTYEP